MFEAKNEPLASKQDFLKRFSRNLFIGLMIIVLSLACGMIGYRYLENMTWIDSYLNASMILAGEGPVEQLHTVEGKLFAGLYALFSGIVFLVVIAFVFAPVFHRIFHKFHLGN